MTALTNHRLKFLFFALVAVLSALWSDLATSGIFCLMRKTSAIFGHFQSTVFSTRIWPFSRNFLGINPPFSPCFYNVRQRGGLLQVPFSWVVFNVSWPFHRKLRFHINPSWNAENPSVSSCQASTSLDYRGFHFRLPYFYFPWETDWRSMVHWGDRGRARKIRSLPRSGNNVFLLRI